MNSGKFRTIKAFILALATIMVGETPAFAAEKTLVLGVAFRTLYKYDENTVTALMNGVEAARQQYEKDHPGVKIQLKRYAHSEDMVSVTEVAKKVLEDRIPALLGAEMSGEAIVLGDIFKGKDVVLISPTASSPVISEGRPYVFSACFSDRQVSEKLARFAHGTLKPKAVGVVRNISSPYSDFLAGQFTRDLLELKPSYPVLEKQFIDKNTDFSKMIDAFMTSSVNVVAFLGHQSDLFRFHKQATEKGYFPTYIGSDAWGTNERLYENLIQNSKHGHRFVAYRNAYWKDDVNDSEAQKFRKAYKRVGTDTPGAWGAIAYDTATLLFKAADQAKSPGSGASIREELLKLKKIPLVTSTEFTFTGTNFPEKDLYIYRLDKSGIRYESTLR